MRNRSGFTIVELLSVVVIIGTLTAMAIPRFANTKQKAVLAAMRSDLHNLVGAEEAHWIDTKTYYGGALPAAGFEFEPSQGVIVTIVSATPGGWSATAASPGVPAITCAIFHGAVPALPPASNDDAVACN
jgi:prepilin-type N-terminal cleavage/methylation domain-containing protein